MEVKIFATCAGLEKIYPGKREVSFNDIRTMSKSGIIGNNCYSLSLKDNGIQISKLIDGSFPEYQSFIPTSNESKLVINTKLLANAIDRVATVTVDKFRAVKLFIGNESMEITASGEAKGAASEVLHYSLEKDNSCNYVGSNVSIGFNPRSRALDKTNLV